MKQFSQQIKKHANSIRLSAAERRDLSERLQAYMEYHPLPKDWRQPATARVPKGAIEAEAFTMWRIPALYVRGALGALTLMLIVGVPLAAERAVPGDVLYPFKVSVNEEVRSGLVFSEYQEIEWETERLGRRIAEARFLANEGRLTPEVEAEVAEAVKNHSDAAQAAIRELRNEDSEEAAIAEITLASNLDVQSAVLNSPKVATTTKGKSTGEIAQAVAAAQADAAKNKSTTTVSYERLSARVEQETTRAEELFASVREFAAEPEVNEVKRRFDDIARKFNSAAKLREEAPARAVTLLEESLSATQKLIVFMTDIDVQENVSIDELIPEERSDEERREYLRETVAKIEQIRAAVAAELDELAPEKAEKVQAALISINSLLGQATDARQAGELEKAERHVREALAFAEDVERIALLDLPPAPAPSESPRGSSTATSSATTTSETASTTAPVATSTTPAVPAAPTTTPADRSTTTPSGAATSTATGTVAE